jgi:YD repeat-containing protein
MTYDLLGRKTAMSDPDMGQWSYTYDDAGNLISQTDARGRKTCFYYDALGRLTGKAYDCFGDCPAGPEETVYTYDQGTLGKGYRTAISATLGITATGAPLTASWRYDARGRVISENLGIAGEVYGRRWGYNIADQVERQVSPAEPAAAGRDGDTGYDVYGRPGNSVRPPMGQLCVANRLRRPRSAGLMIFGNNDRTTMNLRLHHCGEGRAPVPPPHGDVGTLERIKT